jgi:hypothetical protein
LSRLSSVQTSVRCRRGRVGRPRPPADVCWTAYRPPEPTTRWNGRPLRTCIQTYERPSTSDDQTDIFWMQFSRKTSKVTTLNIVITQDVGSRRKKGINLLSLWLEKIPNSTLYTFTNFQKKISSLILVLPCFKLQYLSRLEPSSLRISTDRHNSSSTSYFNKFYATTKGESSQRFSRS